MTGLVGGVHFILSYSPSGTADSRSEAVFDSEGRVRQLTGSSLEAAGRVVLRKGDSEALALALLGPGAEFRAETAHTVGAYWQTRHTALLLRGDWAAYRYRRYPDYTVSCVTLWRD